MEYGGGYFLIAAQSSDTYIFFGRKVDQFTPLPLKVLSPKHCTRQLVLSSCIVATIYALSCIACIHFLLDQIKIWNLLSCNMTKTGENSLQNMEYGCHYISLVLLFKVA